MQDIGNSLPSRNSSLIKRKIPDTFYAPPVLKTQVFSSSEIISQPKVPPQQRSHINHSHTNSLPVDTSSTAHPFSQATPNIHPSGSVNNLAELTSSAQFTPMKTQQQQQQQSQIYSTYSPMHMSAESKLAQSNYVNQSPHAKTYSLPVSFDQQQQQQQQQQGNYSSTNHLLQPPVRNKHLGDIPLPEGYTYETTPTGQIYFINHITKTTQWHDPRSYYNLPMNQNEMSKDLRTAISNTIPLPPHWEEARTPAGEVYYINHATQTTTWSDPRLSIYMQQENLKYSSQNMNSNLASLKMSGNNTSASNSSLYSPYSSSASSINADNTTTSSSSTNSLNTMNSLGNQYDYAQQQLQQHQQQQHHNQTNKSSNYQLISNLKKNLDQLLNKKYQICKELEDLSKQEMTLKSKLSQQDLDDVLRMLKSADTSMSSFSQYDSTNNGENTLTTTITTTTTNSSATSKVDNTSGKLNTTTDTELDSTLVVGDHNSTLNTSAI